MQGGVSAARLEQLCVQRGPRSGAVVRPCTCTISDHRRLLKGRGAVTYIRAAHLGICLWEAEGHQFCELLLLHRGLRRSRSRSRALRGGTVTKGNGCLRISEQLHVHVIQYRTSSRGYNRATLHWKLSAATCEALTVFCQDAIAVAKNGMLKYAARMRNGGVPGTPGWRRVVQGCNR